MWFLLYMVHMYIIIIIMIMYVHMCSHTFNCIQFLVRNVFNEYRHPSSLMTNFVFVVWRLSCLLILYLHIIPVYKYVILPISFYLFMCMYGPSNIDGHISAGHNPIYSGQGECGGPLIG